MKNMKKSLKTFTKYEISIDYDDEGFVNKITIEINEEEFIWK